jgi:hypothetical protein
MATWPAPKTIFRAVATAARPLPDASGCDRAEGGPEIRVERLAAGYEPKLRLSEEDAADGLLEVLGGRGSG